MKRAAGDIRADRTAPDGQPEGDRDRARWGFLAIDGLPDLESNPVVAEDHHRFDLPRLSSGDVAAGLSPELKDELGRRRAELETRRAREVRQAATMGGVRELSVYELEAAEAMAGLEVQPGDALLVRTGRWQWRRQHGPWDAGSLAAGLDASCLPWLRARDVATLGSDGVSDVLPSGVEGVGMPIHTVVIVAMGVHLLDNLDLDALAVACAEEDRWEFLFTVAPLVLRRGTASPINPIALF